MKFQNDKPKESNPENLKLESSEKLEKLNINTRYGKQVEGEGNIRNQPIKKGMSQEKPKSNLKTKVDNSRLKQHSVAFVDKKFSQNLQKFFN